MQQTADVEILWITVDVAAECLPAYGSFFSSAAVADGDAMATDVDVEMTAACGSSFFSAAVVDSETDSETDAVMDADVETAVATADAAANYKTQILFVQTDQRRGKLYSPPFLCFVFALFLLLFVFLFLLLFLFLSQTFFIHFIDRISINNNPAAHLTKSFH